MFQTRVTIPTLVRIKAGALARAGVYLSRVDHRRVVVFQSVNLSDELLGTFANSLAGERIEVASRAEVVEASFEKAVEHFRALPRDVTAIVGLGGGRALDVAKYVAFLAKLPYFSFPTSLSNDGFSSPVSSLTVARRRRTLSASMPYGVVVDTTICQHAPRPLTMSGVGDLAAKVTAIHDWKLAFRNAGTPIDDFSVLLTTGAVQAFFARPTLDEEGIRTLATSLLLCGIAMEISGSSRPASGSEHLISHALDALSDPPRLHGIQVGIATYLMSLAQKNRSEEINHLFEVTGFWDEVYASPFSRSLWFEAIRLAPSMKQSFYTIFSTRDLQAELQAAIETDPRLSRCLRDD
ncbi:MAG: iron-containing alcohol dehydrogenase family protein [Pirellulales bacterium]